jgi:hypothetical protein
VNGKCGLSVSCGGWNCVRYTWYSVMRLCERSQSKDVAKCNKSFPREAGKECLLKASCPVSGLHYQHWSSWQVLALGTSSSGQLAFSTHAIAAGSDFDSGLESGRQTTGHRKRRQRDNDLGTCRQARNCSRSAACTCAAEQPARLGRGSRREKQPTRACNSSIGIEDHPGEGFRIPPELGDRLRF